MRVKIPIKQHHVLVERNGRITFTRAGERWCGITSYTAVVASPATNAVRLRLIYDKLRRLPHHPYYYQNDNCNLYYLDLAKMCLENTTASSVRLRFTARPKRFGGIAEVYLSTTPVKDLHALGIICPFIRGNSLILP